MEDLEIFFAGHESNIRKAEIYRAGLQGFRQKADTGTYTAELIGSAAGEPLADQQRGGGTSGGSAARQGNLWRIGNAAGEPLADQQRRE